MENPYTTELPEMKKTEVKNPYMTDLPETYNFEKIARAIDSQVKDNIQIIKNSMDEYEYSYADLEEKFSMDYRNRNSILLWMCHYIAKGAIKLSIDEVNLLCQKWRDGGSYVVYIIRKITKDNKRKRRRR